MPRYQQVKRAFSRLYGEVPILIFALLIMGAVAILYFEGF
jgi:hypothetical protein